MLKRKVMVCTVGGSPDPVVAAIRQGEPHFVCFLCTGTDPVTGAAGSEVQVVPGAQGEPAPLPVAAGLETSQYEVVRIPADNLDAAFELALAALQGLRARWPECELLADYTGGTKTMSLALGLAAQEVRDVGLQLVTAGRENLLKVQGESWSLAACTQRIRLERAFTAARLLWAHYAYAEAAQLVAAVEAPRDPELRAERERLLLLSRGFAAWDRFDYAGAAALLGRCRSWLEAHGLADLLPALARLASEAAEDRLPALAWDLWLNAQRRAHQECWEDAFVRVGRALELARRWRPGTTGDAAGASPASRYFDNCREPLADFMTLAQHAVLAGGDHRIGAEDWRRCDGLLFAAFGQMLAAEVGWDAAPSQFPDACE